MKPKTRFWIGLLAVVIGIACVLAVFFSSVGAVGAANRGARNMGISEESPQEHPTATQIYEGVVTDTHCGAKHTPAIAESAGDCTRVCVHSGEHFALVNGDKMYVLEGENQLLNHAAGERVTIAGTLSGDTISVTSVRLPAP